MTLSLFRTRLLAGALAAFVLLLDQASKAYFMSPPHMVDLPLEVFPFLTLIVVLNRGISFGMFSQFQEWGPPILTLGALLIVLVLLVWMARTRAAAVIFALACVSGGALGNIIDRIRFGAVIDFLDFHLGPHHWPAFNIADSAIFIGVVILFFISIVKPSGRS